MSNERALLERFFEEEFQLFEAARHTPDSDAGLKSVCHAIIWACCLDEFHVKQTPNYATWLLQQTEARALSGLRFARNRAIHQFTPLLQVTGGASFPLRLPSAFFEIKWRPRATLPPPDPKHALGKKFAVQAADYDTLLANSPVRLTLGAVAALFPRVP